MEVASAPLWQLYEYISQKMESVAETDKYQQTLWVETNIKYVKILT